jgi:hypothetical protein
MLGSRRHHEPAQSPGCIGYYVTCVQHSPNILRTPVFHEDGCVFFTTNHCVNNPDQRLQRAIGNVMQMFNHPLDSATSHRKGALKCEKINNRQYQTTAFVLVYRQSRQPKPPDGLGTIPLETSRRARCPFSHVPCCGDRTYCHVLRAKRHCGLGQLFSLASPPGHKADQ